MVVPDRYRLEDEGDRAPGRFTPPDQAPADWSSPDQAASRGRADDDLVGPDTPDYSDEAARFAPPPPPPAPWWEPALLWARSPRGMVLIGGGAALLVAALVVLHPADKTIRVSRIRRGGEGLDGQAVEVRGQVCDVYPVGDGYAFYLRQGRDTIVVFTRSRTPVRGETVKVKGVVSAASLRGQVHQAVLETGP